jgi:hypothetical protein
VLQVAAVAECLLWAKIFVSGSSKKKSTKEISTVASVGLEGNMV